MPETLSFLATKNTNGNSWKPKDESSKTLNSFLYSKPGAIERLTQGQSTTLPKYQNYANGHILAFERAFDGNGVARTEGKARA